MQNRNSSQINYLVPLEGMHHHHDIDNDRDGYADYPEDDGCISAGDYSERGTCGDIYDPPRLRKDQEITVNTSRGLFESAGSCGGRGSPELVFSYVLEEPVEALIITTGGERTEVPTTLYVRRTECLDPDYELGCIREEQEQWRGYRCSERCRTWE